MNFLFTLSIPATLGLISGAFLIIGYLPYIYEVLRKTTVPNRASWFIWSLSTAIILFGVDATGTHEAIWVPIADAVGCFSIFVFSIFLGTGGWSKTDKISLAVWLYPIVLVATVGTLYYFLVRRFFHGKA